MDKILHDPKDPKLWELWYIPLMQDFVHQPYHKDTICVPLAFGNSHTRRHPVDGLCRLGSNPKGPKDPIIRYLGLG